jgi:predicted nucleotide-binding protein (sugar kinase/HSP70/actin superfamily)
MADCSCKKNEANKKSNKKKVVVLGVSFISDNKKLTQEICKIIEEKGIDALTEQNSELLNFIRHGVVLAPAVIIDGKLKSAGRIPKKQELEKWIDTLHDDIMYEKELESAENSADIE